MIYVAAVIIGMALGTVTAVFRYRKQWTLLVVCVVVELALIVLASVLWQDLLMPVAVLVLAGLTAGIVVDVVYLRKTGREGTESSHRQA